MTPFVYAGHMILKALAGEDIPERLAVILSSIDVDAVVQVLIAGVIVSPIAYVLACFIMKDRNKK